MYHIISLKSISIYIIFPKPQDIGKTLPLERKKLRSYNSCGGDSFEKGNIEGLAAALLALSLLLLVAAGDFSARNVESYYIAFELYRMPVALLLISWLAALAVN